MIHVKSQPEPASFDVMVRRPGRAALKEQRQPPLWQGKCLEALSAAYGSVCAYLGIFIHPGTATPTVDHFLPKSVYPKLAYEWSNYRLASARVNGNKSTQQGILDPFQLKNGTFVLEFLTFEVSPASHLTSPLRDQAQATIDRLKLNSEEFKRARAACFDLWINRQISDALFDQWYPFVAFEAHREFPLR